MSDAKTWDAIIVGGGIAGLSAAIYLGRAERDTLVIDSGKSMAEWVPKADNYLGFPKGIPGADLLRRGERQAKRYRVRFTQDEVLKAGKRNGVFKLHGRKISYCAKYVLLATGIFHIPPDINGVRACLGHSMFFCKDCDGVRVRGKKIAIYGANNETVEYALGMLLYSSSVAIVTDGRTPKWAKAHARWVREYQVPIYTQPIQKAQCLENKIKALKFCDGTALTVEALFTTRGDIFYNDLAKKLGAKIAHGEIVVDSRLRTTVKGLYAAGCVTPANCQMIIAAGQGATAAQSINRELFEESIASHALRRFRHWQLRNR
jgi:thioredoxin reductase (NADPH)